MRTRLLCLASLLFLIGCLDWSTAAPLDDAGTDAGGMALDAGMQEDAGDEPSSCPQRGDCDARCGTVAVDGCPPYECPACDDASVCMPKVTCASIAAECGVVQNGCEAETCADQCDGLPCEAYRCCVPEDVAITCRGACGGTRVNNCEQEVPCENPCGPSSRSCTESRPPVAAVCECPTADQGETCEQTQVVFDNLVDVAFDAQARFDYVLEGSRNAVVRIQRPTGTRKVFSDDDDEGASRGIGPGFSRPEAILLDAQHKRLFVSDRNRRAVLEVSLQNGDRKTLSDSEDAGLMRGSGPAFQSPMGMTLDTPRERLFVADAGGALYVVDLDGGDRTIVSGAGPDGAVVGTGPSLSQARRVALDMEHGTAYVFCGNALVGVDIDTGNRRLVSTGSTEWGEQRGAGPAFQSSSGILDLARSRALVLTGSAPFALLAIDLASGDRTIASGMDEQQVQVGTGPSLDESPSISLEPDGDHVLVVLGRYDAVLRIDTTNGNRTTLYDSNVGQGPVLDAPRSLDLLASEGVAYVADRNQGILKVDLTSGDRSMVLPMTRLGDAALDASGKVAYVVDEEGLVRVPLESGVRTVLSNNENPTHNTVPLVLDTPYMVLDLDADRVLVVQPDASSVVAIDVTDGRRSVVSGAARGDGPDIGIPCGAALDRRNRRLYVSNRHDSRVLSVNLETGERAIISGATEDGATTVGEGPPLTGPCGISLTPEEGGLYVANGDLFRIDVVTGDRAPMSVRDTGLGVSSSTGLGLTGTCGLSLDATAGFAYTCDWMLGRYELATGNRRMLSRGMSPP